MATARRSMEVNGKSMIVEGTYPSIVRLEQEWYEDVDDPEWLIKAVRETKPAPDILTFWQRLPDLEPRYSYKMRREPIAALPIKSYSSWFTKQIDASARNKIRKAEKKGVMVKPASFDDRFVEGMTSIFNETPIRQGRRYLHYGKDFDTVKCQFSRFLFREELFGAYLGDELIGFIMLANAGKYAVLGQIVSKIARRDLAPNNSLIAKAVERSAEKELPYLTYAYWLDDGLGDFKRSNGFQKFDLPRYFVALTQNGKLALTAGLHRGWKEAVPKRVRNSLKKLRRRWYGLRNQANAFLIKL